MIISLEQILEDEEVERAIFLMVQAELKKANKSFAQKVHQLELSEQENFFLKSKIIELERSGLRKDVALRELRRELQNERARLKIIVNTKKADISSGSGGDGDIHYSSSDSTMSTSPPVKRSLNFDEDPTSGNPFSFLKAHNTDTTCASSDTTIRTTAIEKGESNFVHERDMITAPERWTCSCGTEFKCKSYLSRHIRYYDGNKKFKCLKCTNVQFALPTELRKHLKGKHKLPPAPWMRYACHDCGSFFETSTELYAHRRKDHSKMLKSDSPFPSQIISLENIKKEKDDADAATSSTTNSAKAHRKQKKLNSTNVTKDSKK